MDNKRKRSFRRASFMKVLEDDFIKKLPIPPAFTKIFEEGVPPWLILEIAGTRKCWRVDIEEEENGGMYLSFGFDCFVEACTLERGNFFLFELEEPSILQVKIYEKDGSAKTVGKNFETEYKDGAYGSPKHTPIIHQKRESNSWSTMPFTKLAAMDNKRKLSYRRASFTKILEDDFIKKLPMPSAFTKIFEEEIPPWLVLEISGTRKCWRVDIEVDEIGRMYLSCGFDCFVEAQSLKVGNFLFFELEEQSILQVKIYEKDGSEKAVGTNFETEHKVGDYETPRQTPIIHQERESSSWPTMPSVQYGAYEKKKHVIGGIKQKKGIVSATERGLCFSVTWREANHFIYYLTIPKSMLTGRSFSNKETVVLQNRDGISWPVELRRRPDGRMDLAQGWREFVTDNDLTTGDTLTLEFVSNNVIQVHVRRAFQVDNPSQREQDHKIEPTEYLNMACDNEELAANCTIINDAPIRVGKIERATVKKMESVASEFQISSFTITWTQKTSNSYMHIPKAIANKQKLENKDIVVLCDPEGKQWLTEVRTRQSDGRVGLGRGWAEFTRAYGFGVGDTLIFKFVTNRMMEVHIIKACGLDRAVTRGTIKQEVLNLD